MKKLLFYLFLISLVSCNDDIAEGLLCDIPLGNGEIENLTIEEENVIDSLNTFSIKLLAKASTSAELYNADENIALSPYGAALNLAVLANSADDDITSSILDILGVNSLATLNSTMQKLDKSVSFKSSDEVTAVSKSVWYNSDIAVSKSWEKNIKSVFSPYLKGVSFANPKTLSDINSWCYKTTDGMIPCILDELDPEESLVLLNSFYFSGKWLTPFKIEQTKEKEFNGTQKVSRVPMMHIGCTFMCTVTDEFKAVSLPFTGPTELILVLPKEGTDIREFASSLSYERLKDRKKAKMYEVSLDMPRFEIGTEANLTEVFKIMGLPETFRLEKMGDDKAKRMKIRQSSAVSIDEEGARASTVTINEIIDGYCPLERIGFAFDRPFVFLFENSSTGTFTMAGIISNL